MGSGEHTLKGAKQLHVLGEDCAGHLDCNTEKLWRSRSMRSQSHFPHPGLVETDLILRSHNAGRDSHGVLQIHNTH